MPKCKIILPAVSGLFLLSSLGRNFYSALLTKVSGNMQLTSFECVSPQYLLQLSHPMSIVNQIPKFASAPRKWAVFTNSSAITLLPLLIRCPMNFSPTYLPAPPRIFLVRLLLHTQMLTPILPIPLYLLSTPMSQPISFKLSKKLFVQLQCQRPNIRRKD